MNHARFLKIALPAIAIPALIVLFLPARVWSFYVDIVEPLSLLIGGFLALYVSRLYRKELKAAFVYLSAFLFIYMLTIILFLSYSPILVSYLEPHMGNDRIHLIVNIIQFINYAVLFLFCVNLLKVVDVRQLDSNGWIVLAMVFILCIDVALYPEIDLIGDISTAGPLAVLYIIRRVFDAALVIVLTPVLWLYIQHLRSRHEQSLTFTVIILGVVCSTIFNYLFEFILEVFPNLLSQGSHLYVIIPEMLFIYGYLLIAAGLYAHRKEDQWGYDIIDKAMTGESKLVDVE